jgi:hypothetical protein
MESPACDLLKNRSAGQNAYSLPTSTLDGSNQPAFITQTRLVAEGRSVTLQEAQNS